VERFTRWLKAFPLSDITAEAVSSALLFGYTDGDVHRPSRRPSVQDKPKTSAANGLVELLHRMLICAIMCNEEEQ
jgi:hypothetical protein